MQTLVQEAGALCWQKYHLYLLFLYFFYIYKLLSMLRQEIRLHFSSDLINLFLFANSLLDLIPKTVFFLYAQQRKKTFQNVTCSYAFAQQANFVIFSGKVIRNYSNGFHRYFATVRDGSFQGLLIFGLVHKVCPITFFYILLPKLDEFHPSVWILSVLFSSVTVPMSLCHGLVSYTSIFLS